MPAMNGYETARRIRAADLEWVSRFFADCPRFGGLFLESVRRRPCHDGIRLILRSQRMPNARRRADQIQTGSPLPFDVFDARGKLLLSRGVLTINPASAERLEALYAEQAALDETLPAVTRCEDGE
jgi:hypothetical protein